MTENRVSSKPLKDFLKSEGLTQAAAGDIIGVSGPAIGTWLTTNEMPRYMLLCLEGVKRRRRAKANKDALFVVKLAAGKVEAFKILIDALGADYTQILED